jgi:pimeloyl-ACP methyl ester carboxylesterase
VKLICSGEREAACYDGAAALELWPLVAQIRAPLLLVLGDRSAVAPALCDRLVAALPSAQVATIPGGSHFVALEKPRELGAVIARFLDERA